MPKTLNIESPVKDFIVPANDLDKVGKRILADLDQVQDFFKTKIEKRNSNYDFYIGNQWTEEEKQSIRMQNRIPFVFNEIHHKVEHLVGTQTQTRLESRPLPRERGDAATAELLGFLLKWAEQMNDLEIVETDVFRDGLVGAAGASVVRWENRDIQYGYPVVEKVPINELRWDLNAKKPDLSDARWMSRVSYATRFDAIEQFPAKKQEILDAPRVDGTTMGGDLIYNELSTHQEEVIESLTGSATDIERELIRIIEYYEQARIYQYTVADEIASTVMTFDSKNEAEGYYQGLLDSYTEQGEELMNLDFTPRIAMVTSSRKMFMQSIMVGDKVLYYQPTNIDAFPWDIYFAYFWEGFYWAFVDVLIDPQMLVNRFFSQWDHQLGTSTKNAITVMTSLLPKDWQNLEKVRSELSKTAPVLPVRDHAAYQHIPNAPITPELFQGIQWSLSRMEDYSGGRNVLGFQENAAESGRAVIARAEQGGVARLPLFDRLRIWRKSVAQKLVWYMKNYMTPGQIVRILGMDDNVQFVELDDDVLGTLREIEVDIHIDEAFRTETSKLQYFQALKELAAVVSLPPEILMPMMVEYSPIPESKKRELLEQFEFYKGYVQEKAQLQKEQKLTQEVMDSLLKKQIKEQAERADELKTAEREATGFEKKLKTKLEDIEEAKMAMREQNLSPQEMNQLFNKLQTPEELEGRPSASTAAVMEGS